MKRALKIFEMRETTQNGTKGFEANKMVEINLKGFGKD